MIFLDIYGPMICAAPYYVMLFAFYTGKSITRARGRGLGPGNRDFLALWKNWHRTVRRVPQGPEKNLKNGPSPRPRTNLACHQKPNPSRPFKHRSSALNVKLGIQKFSLTVHCKLSNINLQCRARDASTVQPSKGFRSYLHRIACTVQHLYSV